MKKAFIFLVLFAQQFFFLIKDVVALHVIYKSNKNKKKLTPVFGAVVRVGRYGYTTKKMLDFICKQDKCNKMLCSREDNEETVFIEQLDLNCFDYF